MGCSCSEASKTLQIVCLQLENLSKRVPAGAGGKPAGSWQGAGREPAGSRHGAGREQTESRQIPPHVCVCVCVRACVCVCVRESIQVFMWVSPLTLRTID